MRVTVISQVPPPVHGSTLVTQLLLETLTELGVEVRMVDRRFSRSVSEVGRFSARKLLSAMGLVMRLVVCLSRFRPRTVVFFATNRSFSFLVDWTLSEVLRVSRTQSILYIHTIGFKALAQRGPLWSFLVRRLLSSADMVVCLGPALASDLAPWVHESRIHFIANALPEQPQAVATPKTSERSVLFLSNALPEKGADTFVEVAALVSGSGLSSRFLLAGSPTDDTFERLLSDAASERQLGERLRRVRSMSPVEKWQLISECAVFVFPSRYPFEAQPLVIIEALAAGKPVVAFDIGGVRDLVTDGVNGYVVSNGDTAEMARRVSELLTDTSLQALLGTQARTSYLSHHTREAFRTAWARALDLDEGPPLKVRTP